MQWPHQGPEVLATSRWKERCGWRFCGAWRLPPTMGRQEGPSLGSLSFATERGYVGVCRGTGELYLQYSHGVCACTCACVRQL